MPASQPDSVLKPHSRANPVSAFAEPTAFLLTVLFSPYEWPVTAQNFNFSSGESPAEFSVAFTSRRLRRARAERGKKTSKG